MGRTSAFWTALIDIARHEEIQAAEAICGQVNVLVLP